MSAKQAGSGIRWFLEYAHVNIKRVILVTKDRKTIDFMPSGSILKTSKAHAYLYRFSIESSFCEIIGATLIRQIFGLGFGSLAGIAG